MNILLEFAVKIYNLSWGKLVIMSIVQPVLI